MKKVLFFLLTSLLASTAVLRAETLTVNDGSATDNYVPIAGGSLATNYVRCQTVYSASELEDVTGSEITSLTLYLSYNLSYDWTSNFKISMTEISSPGIAYTGTYYKTASFLNDSKQTVYQGTIKCENKQILITFETPYLYQGGNLLVEFLSTSKGNSVSGSFYGKTGDAGVNLSYSVQATGSYSVPTSGEAIDFAPKTTFSYVPGASACAKTSEISITDVTDSHATISWTPVDGAESYDLTVGTTTYTNLTTCTKQVTGLNPATEYTVGVVTNCGDSEASGAKNTTFTTPCGTISSFPWGESFDGLSTGIPSCWDNSEGTTSDASYKWNSYATGQSGKCVRFDSYYNNYGTNFLTTPTIQLDSKSYKLSFYYKNPKGGDCELYINTTKVATYKQISSWTLQEYDLSSYAGQSIVVKWKGISNYGNGDAYIYLDEVTIEADNSCKAPSALSVPDGNITSNSAQISWTNGGSETAWKIQYKKSDAAEFTEVSAESNPFTLTGLSASTTYTVQVAADCGAGEESAYSVSTSFTTLCGAVTSFPWRENFNSLASGIPTCWDNSEGTNTNHTYDWQYYSSGAGYSGGCVAFYPYYNSGKYNILKTPLLQLANKPYRLSFQYELDSYAATCELLIYVDGDVQQTINLEHASSWEEKTIMLSQYAGSTIQLGWKATALSGYGSRVRIDDIEVVELPECVNPSNLTATALTSNSATLSWDKGWNETSWNLKYKVATAGEWQMVNSITKPYVLTGLAANTAYQVMVSPTCGEQWSETASFRTECGDLEIGYTYSFEDDEADASPRCWRVGCVSGGTTPTVYQDAYTSYAHDGSKSLRLFYSSSNGKQAWVVMPVLPDDVDAKDLQVSAFAASSPSYTDHFQVGIMTDPSDINTFVGYNFPTRQNAPETPCSKVKLDQYTGDGKYIAFRVVANINAFLDEVKVTRIVKAPTNIVVTADQTTASVTFDQVDSKGKWQYQLNEQTPVTITSQSFELSDLTAETAYTLKLRHVDEENGEYSDWVDADFETASSWILPTNVQVVDVDVHTATITFEQVDGKSVGWTYQYAQTPDFTGTTLTERTTSITTVNLEGLAEGRTYYFRVHQTGHLGHWTSAVSFTTDCSPLMYGETYTFDDQENKRVPACWTNLHQDNLDYTSTVFEADSYNYAHSGTKALRINAYGDAGYFQTIAMPAVADDQDIKEIILEFWVMGSVNSGTLENCVLEVGVMTDADDKNTFTAVESFTPDGSWRLHSTNFSSYTGTGKHIAFRTIGNKPGYNYKFFIDDLMLNKKELIRHHPSTTQYGTICLNKRTIELEGATFWKIAYKTRDLTYIMIEQVYELEAGRAYIFMPEQFDIYGVMVGEAVASPVAAADNNGLQGTFEAIVAAETNALTGNYMLYNNAFMECGKNCSMPANRAYMVLSKVCFESDAAPQMAPRRALGSGVSQTTTALDNLSENAIGVQKKIVDGRLYIVREGKTYDVDGRLVK